MRKKIMDLWFTLLSFLAFHTPYSRATIPAQLPYCGSYVYSVSQWVTMPNSKLQYYTSSTPLPRTEAADFCLAQGSSLASLHSADENRFVFCQHTGIMRWIGMDLTWGTKRRLDGQSWTDESPVDFGLSAFPKPFLHPDDTAVPWYRGLPAFVNNNEYCVLQGSVRGSPATWTDANCNSPHGFVCKKCINGFSGPTCDTVVDYCANNKCVYGDCVPQIDTADYSCTCKPGAGLQSGIYVAANPYLEPLGIAPLLGTSVTRTTDNGPVVWTIVGPDVLPGWWHNTTDFLLWQNPNAKTNAMPYVTLALAAPGSITFNYSFVLYDESEGYSFLFLYVVENAPILDDAALYLALSTDKTPYVLATQNNTQGTKVVTYAANSTLVWGVFSADSVFGRGVGTIQLLKPDPRGNLCQLF